MRNLEIRWDWLRDNLLLTCPPIFVVFYLMGWVYWAATTSSFDPLVGRPLGGDFSYCWSAATLALGGEPAAVYEFARLRGVELAHFGVSAILPWLYPPTYLLLVLPFALLPYHAALALWLVTTLSGYLYIIRRIAPRPQFILLTLAFPGTLQNLFYGQNGFLSGIFLGGGLLLLDRSPWIAGLLLALLTYKPHLAVLVPVALIAGRRWRALLAMGVSTAALVLATTMLLGIKVWIAFFNHIFLAMKTIEAGNQDLLFLNPSVFSTALLSGAGVFSARILQGATMLTAAGLVTWVWSRGAAPAMRNAALVLGILLFIPYGYVYDLALLALPLAWLGWQGYTGGWRPGEKTCLFLAWLTPILSPQVAMATRVHIAPLVLGALLCLVLRRALQESPSAG